MYDYDEEVWYSSQWIVELFFWDLEIYMESKKVIAVLRLMNSHNLWRNCTVFGNLSYSWKILYLYSFASIYFCGHFLTELLHFTDKNLYSKTSKQLGIAFVEKLKGESRGNNFILFFSSFAYQWWCVLLSILLSTSAEDFLFSFCLSLRTTPVHIVRSYYLLGTRHPYFY